LGSTQNPVLVDTEFLGQTRKVLAWPNRNGFFYLIDRTNGKFLSATAFVKQTWNDGFDYENNGRPKIVPGMQPTPEGNDRVWPGIDGGANWMAHSYSPLTRLLYVFAREEHRAFTKNEVPHPTTEERAGGPPGGGRGGGGRPPRFAPEESWGKAIAIDPKTGKIAWEHKVVSPPVGRTDEHGRQRRFRRNASGGHLRAECDDWRAAVYLREQWPGVWHQPSAISPTAKQLVSIPAGDLIVTLGLD
jgi:alcohol dehydrogenase (cytochrome c)